MTGKDDDIEGKEDDFEIEIEIAEEPETPKDPPRLSEGESPEIPTDEDLAQYSEGVQKRIKKLTFAANEERRQKEEAIRQQNEAVRLQNEAVEFARRKMEEAAELQKRLQKGDETIISQAQQRVKAEMERAKAQLKSAYEAGDSDAVVEANSKIAALAAEASRISDYRPRQPTPAPQGQPAVQPNQPKPAQVAAPSPRARDWASRNSWFGKDEEMTALAFGVHERIVREGVAPDSEAYYTQIDAAVKQRFPDKFGGSEGTAPRRQPSSVVAPGGRSAATTPRKVVLTPSQVALARRLGLPPEVYAAQLIKEQKNG